MRGGDRQAREDATDLRGSGKQAKVWRSDFTTPTIEVS